MAWSNWLRCSSSYSGEKLRFGILTNNSGKTPALHVKAEMTFIYWYKEHPLNLEAGVTKIVGQSVSAIQPGAQGHIYTSESDEPLSNDGVALLKSGDLKMDLKTAVTCETYNEAN